MKIGDYALGRPVGDESRLTEVSGIEKFLLKRTFSGEEIRKAPPARFMDVDWDVILAIVEGRIYKLSAQFSSEEASFADKVLSGVINFCRAQFGEAVQHRMANAHRWATPFGSVMVDRHSVLGSQVINFHATLENKEWMAESTPLVDQADAATAPAILEESGPQSSLISRVRCGEFWLLIHTSEKRPMAGLETSIGIMTHETATPEETSVKAEIVWPITADKPTKHRLHRFLTGVLAEGYSKTNPAKEWQLGLGFEAAMASMRNNGLLKSYTSSFSNHPFDEIEEDDAGDTTAPEDEPEQEDEECGPRGSIAQPRENNEEKPQLAHPLEDEPLQRVRGWQERVILAYPKIGIADTRENKSFVAEYRRRGTPETALDIANFLRASNWPITIPGLED